MLKESKGGGKKDLNAFSYVSFGKQDSSTIYWNKPRFGWKTVSNYGECLLKFFVMIYKHNKLIHVRRNIFCYLDKCLFLVEIDLKVYFRYLFCRISSNCVNRFWPHTFSPRIVFTQLFFVRHLLKYTWQNN